MCKKSLNFFAAKTTFSNCVLSNQATILFILMLLKVTKKKFGGAMSYAMTASPKIGATTVFENYWKSLILIKPCKKGEKIRIVFIIKKNCEMKIAKLNQYQKSEKQSRKETDATTMCENYSKGLILLTLQKRGKIAIFFGYEKSREIKIAKLS